MKRILTLILLFFLPIAGSYAKKKIAGYFVTNTKDTISCTFLVPYGFLSGEPNFEQLQYKIRYVGKDGVKQKLLPKDISVYVLNIDGKKITYLSRKNELGIMQSLFADNQQIFLKLRIDGPIKMFNYYVKRQSGGMYNPTMGGFTPGVNYTDENYCLQKKDGPLTYIRWLSFKKDLSEFLSDYPQLAQKVLNKEYKKGDIDIIIKEYNKYMALK